MSQNAKPKGRFHNRKVGGSIPPPATKLTRSNRERHLMPDQFGGTLIRTTFDSPTRGESPNPARELCDLTLLPINHRPFPHVIHNGFIDPVVYRQLCDSFPTCLARTGPSRFSLYWGDDDYQRLLDEEPVWQTLFNVFHSQQFIDWTRKQFAPVWHELGYKVDLSDARYVPYLEDRVDKQREVLREIKHAPDELWVRMEIQQAHVGYNRKIHVDHQRRLLTMLIYFCDYEENRMDGGELLLHQGPKQHSYRDAATRIAPRPNLMLAFPCSNRSFHSVAPITALAAPRNYLQVHISSSVDIWEG